MASLIAEIDERNPHRIALFYPFSHDRNQLVRTIQGFSFVGADKGGPYWTVPLNMTVCRDLRKLFGSDLIVGDELKAWAWREVSRQDQLGKLATAEDAELPVLETVLPKLHNALFKYQRAGAAFVAHGNVIVADQPGLGKTLETIAGIAESGLLNGCHLVIAPKTSLESVWEKELLKWQPHPVFVAPDGAGPRGKMFDYFVRNIVERRQPGWLVVNPQVLTLRSSFDSSACDEHAVGSYLAKELRKCAKDKMGCEENIYSPFPVLDKTEWTTATVDECHKGATRNPKTATAKALYRIKAKKRIALSGTPMTGQPIDLWGSLHFLDPKTFSSKWQWAERWLMVSTSRHNARGATHKEIGGINPERQEEFLQHLLPWVLRRTKAEVAPDLPPKIWSERWVHLSGEQERQYREMEDEAFVRIEEEELAATSILAEFTRLKQFAGAACQFNGNGELRPTFNSAKLDALLELLDERGILDNVGDEKVIIFSQFSQMVDMVVAKLAELGVRALKITGDVTKKGERKRLQDLFQDEGMKGPRVMAMTTTAGGVAITLDRADTVIFLDETWSPSDQEQAEDRAHRVSRKDHQVTIYYIRAHNTIDEYIMDTTGDKRTIHSEILDKHRLAKKVQA